LAPNHIAFNVAKVAVAGFNQNLARNYALQQIWVNMVCAGEIHTPMLQAGASARCRKIVGSLRSCYCGGASFGA
jgi:2-hydroxycyclohexanecarboxyl-CoA dehydrogenase